MNGLIYSVLKFGEKSVCVNEFYAICVRMAVSRISFSKYRDFILNKTGLSIKDYAKDAVSDLFKNKCGKYQYLNKHFGNPNEILKMSEDKVKSMLSALIISKVQQGITETREQNNENYFSDKRAVSLHIKRNKSQIKTFIINNTKYFYNAGDKPKKIENEIPEEVLLDALFSKRHEKVKVSEITRFIFEYIKKQKEYAKFISEKNLYNTISKFYKMRHDTYVKNIKNVNYNDYKEGIYIDYEDIYFKVKSDIQHHIVRNLNEIKYIIINEKMYFYKGHKPKSISNEIPCKELLEELLSKKNQSNRLSAAVKYIFEYLKNQNKYGKFISENNLYTTIARFYEKKKIIDSDNL